MSIPAALVSANARGLCAGPNLELRPEKQSRPHVLILPATREAIVYVSAPGLIIAYLLVRLAGATLMLVIVVTIACPLVWSRDAARRARARDTLRLLICLITGRWIQ